MWKDRAAAPKAVAEALKIIARNLLELGLINSVIPEPFGGAHNDPDTAVASLKARLISDLEDLEKIPVVDRLKQRYARFRSHGHFMEKKPVAA